MPPDQRSWDGHIIMSATHSGVVDILVSLEFYLCWVSLPRFQLEDCSDQMAQCMDGSDQTAQCMDCSDQTAQCMDGSDQTAQCMDGSDQTLPDGLTSHLLIMLILLQSRSERNEFSWLQRFRWFWSTFSKKITDSRYLGFIKSGALTVVFTHALNVLKHLDSRFLLDRTRVPNLHIIMSRRFLLGLFCIMHALLLSANWFLSNVCGMLLIVWNSLIYYVIIVLNECKTFFSDFRWVIFHGWISWLLFAFYFCDLTHRENKMLAQT
jgi:hypothetical protein